MNDRLSWIGELAPYLPPAFGALLGLRYARNQTPAQKVVAFGTSFGLAVYIGPAVAELLSLGPKATVAAGILVAVVGMDAIGGLLAIAAQFRENPARTVRFWLNAWLGRSDRGDAS